MNSLKSPKSLIVLTLLILSLCIFSGCGGSGSDNPGILPVLNHPANIFAEPGDSLIIISWSSVKDAKYKIYYGTQTTNYISTDSSDGASPISTDLTTFTMKGLKNGTTYFIAVSSIIGTRESKLSPEIAITPTRAYNSQYIEVIADNPMAFACTETQNPDPQNITLRIIGGGSIGYSLSFLDNWASALPSSGTLDQINPSASISISVNCSGLNAGNTYNISMTVSSDIPGDTPSLIPIEVFVSSNPIPPQISWSPTSFDLECDEGGTLGYTPTLNIYNQGTEELSWSISNDVW